MKTAVSVPDELFVHAEKWAKSLGTTRSALFAEAVRRYVADLEAASLTAEIDAALDVIGEDDSLAAVTAASRRRLAKGADDW